MDTTTQPAGRHHGRRTRANTRFARRVLFADIGITGTGALLMLLAAVPLAGMLDLPARLLAGAGIFLIPCVISMIWMARQEPPPRSGILIVIAVSLAWVAGCIWLLLNGRVDPNGLGTAFVLAQAIVVLALTDLHALALRKTRRDRSHHPPPLDG